MAPASPDNAADRWKLQVLDEVFKALASSQELSQQLIYKGARVLRLRLQGFLRMSSDNCSSPLVLPHQRMLPQLASPASSLSSPPVPPLSP